MSRVEIAAGTFALAALTAVFLIGNFQVELFDAALKGKSAGPAPAVVSVERVSRAALPVKVVTQGHVVALSQVDVRPLMTGTILKVHFKEGDQLRAGQPLFTIDAVDLEGQLAKAEAKYAEIEAQVDDAERGLARTEQLAKAKFYSSSAVDTSASRLEVLQAQQKAASAEVKQTRAMLDRALITAPISGYSGAIAVHAGSIAQAGAGAPLVNIVQLDPIGVEFTIPESYLAGVLASREKSSTRIEIQDEDGQRLQGRLSFVNNIVNTDSGTITLKAEFPNASRRLWPGGFVKLELAMATTATVVTVPPQAVLEGPNGRFVYVLDEHDVAQERAVAMVRLQDQRAIVTGLNSGETVVVEGQANLRPGGIAKIAKSQPQPLAMQQSPQ